MFANFALSYSTTDDVRHIAFNLRQFLINQFERFLTNHYVDKKKTFQYQSLIDNQNVIEELRVNRYCISVQRLI